MEVQEVVNNREDSGSVRQKDGKLSLTEALGLLVTLSSLEYILNYFRKIDTIFLHFMS